jgi:hypothetical protein
VTEESYIYLYKGEDCNYMIMEATTTTTGTLRLQLHNPKDYDCSTYIKAGIQQKKV